MRRRKRVFVVIAVNAAILFQLAALMVLSVLGYHIAATVVSLIICLSMLAWGWFGYQKIAYFGFFSSLFALSASLPGLFLKSLSTNLALFVGMVFGAISFVYMVFFDAYYVKDLLDLD